MEWPLPLVGEGMIGVAIARPLLLLPLLLLRLGLLLQSVGRCRPNGRTNESASS